jgi:hypothetical protein
MRMTGRSGFVLRYFRHLTTIFTLASSLTACGDDEAGAGVLGTTGLESSGAADGAEQTGPDATGAEGADVTGEPPDADPCDVPATLIAGGFDVVVEDAGTIQVEDACNNAALVGDGPNRLDDETDNFTVYVYRPEVGGQWPADGPRPVVFFVPGNGQRVVDDGEPPLVERYPEVLQSLAAQGFVVIAGTPPFTSGGDNFSSGKRAAMLACMMVWAKGDPNAGGWARAGENRISSAATIAGHSRGGGGATILLDNLAALQSSVLGMDEYEVCAGIPLSPKWSPSDSVDPSSSNLVIDDAAAPPWLVVQAALDEDTERGGGYVYDTMVPEPDLDLSGATPGVQVAPTRANDKMMVWIHGTAHNNFGGTGTQQISADAQARARQAARYYMPQFLVWQMAGSGAAIPARQAFMRLLDPSPDMPEFPAPPAELEDFAIWEDLAQYDVVERPLVFAAYQQGAGSAAQRRYVVDAWDRQTSGELAPPTCGNVAGALGVSTAGFDVQTGEGLLGAQVCHSTTEDALTAEGTTWRNTHNTRAALVKWGAALGDGGVVEWSLDDAEDVAELDLSAYSHVSIRLSNETAVDVDLPNSVCEPAALDSLELEIELVTEDGDGEQHVHATTTGPLLDQSTGLVTPVNSGTECKSFQFLRTVRIPMATFCDGPDGPMSTDAVKAIRLRVPDDPGASHGVYIDSLEFTNDPLDPSGTRCGPAAGAWNCVAGSSLNVQETSCTAQPNPGCPSWMTTTLAKPTVAADDDWPTAFSGWVVHTPKGWVRNLASPTSTELNRIRGLCQQACALEWSDDPAVSANCSLSTAFATPTLRKSNSIGPVHRIPESRRHGAGVFGTQQLACDLENDCCEVFDELVCAAKHRRNTPAERALARTEEYRMTLGGASTKVTFTTPSGSTDLALTGSAGFSFCPQGDGYVNCPFYLGSLNLASNGSALVSATCPDSSSIAIDVSALSVRLMQPAFGIGSLTSNDKAIPEGGLHLRADFVAEGQEFALRTLNEHDVVFMSARRTGFDADDISLIFDVPCGSGTIPVTAQFDLHNTTTTAAPPTITINNASTVPCPSTQTLSATASDPNGDLGPVQWEVDGIRMKPGITTMAFTRNHVLRAYATDARGAVTSKTKSVACQ